MPDKIIKVRPEPVAGKLKGNEKVEKIKKGLMEFPAETPAKAKAEKRQKTIEKGE
jgi:hypothetical protein